MNCGVVVLFHCFDNKLRVIPLQMVSAIAVYQYSAVARQRGHIVELAASLFDANRVVPKNTNNQYRNVTKWMHLPLSPFVDLLQFLGCPHHWVGLCTSKQSRVSVYPCA